MGKSNQKTARGEMIMKVNGFTYGYGARKGNLRTEKAMVSQDKLMDTGINWVCIAQSVNQERYNSTEIFFDYHHTATDKDIIFAIRRFHEKGIKVCLKPIVNCNDGMWRAEIDFPDMNMYGKDVYWDSWFASYSSYILHYAEIAEDEGCEMLCIGCELLGTERKERHWRTLIQEVRKVYHGLLVYNTNHGKETGVKWWDMLDFIGTSAYYPVAKYPGDTLESMVKEWERVSVKLEEVSKKFGKDILFMEAGCRSARGCAKMPWNFTHKELPMDEEEQANFYESCLMVMQEKPWFAGVFWWDWATEVYDSKKIAQIDRGFNIHMKKAEEVLRRWYKK